jgi:23S rRNA (guanine2445-N2)-methyltransferase / 23S rRNA (guanine2069-N7)-methyltransferase
VKDSTFFVTGPKGFETALFHELRAISRAAAAPQRVRKVYGGVELEGGLELAYRACLHSRIANRVYLPLASFRAEDPESLYQGVAAVDWSRHLGDHNSLAVSATLTRSSIDHSHFAALKVKDAIVDFFRNRGGARPVIDKERPDLRVHLHIHKNRATLSLDLSGAPLHRRGYRLQHAGAPLKEHLAAALLATAGWSRDAAREHSLLDPLCGSGTFVIEAAMIAAGIAPGLDREYFGFLRWKGHDKALWQRLLDEAEAAIDPQPEVEIVGCDISRQALDIARDNALRAGVESLIRFEQRAVADLPQLPLRLPPIIIGNPPYGERLQAEEGLAQLYAQMGKAFRHWPGASVHLISANPDLLHRLRLPRRSKKAVSNGPIACVFAHFTVNDEAPAGKSAPVPDESAPGEPASEETRALINRLKKNERHLSRWAKRNDVTCYRLYDADLPEYAFALDRYQSALDPALCWYHLQEYQAPKSIDPDKAAARLQQAVGVLRDRFGIDDHALFIKQRRRQKGREQYRKQDRQGELLPVREGPARLLVNLSDYLDTGLFLDHRITRAMIREQARDKSLLNLFCYTASVSVQAALGGASRTVSVDLSATYLNWARENFAANDLEDEDRHQFLQQDCLELLKRPRRHGLDGGFDLIFLDPPSFSNSKRMSDVLDIQRDHETLIRQAAELLAPGGVLYFSTNRKGFRLAESLGRDLDLRDITRQTIPEDFKRRPKIHQCWEIRVR